MSSKIQHNILIGLTVIFILLIVAVSPMFKKNLPNPSYYNQAFEEATVLEILEEDLVDDPVVDKLVTGTQDLLVEINTGKYKGEVFETTNILDKTHNVHAKEKMTVIVGIRETEDGANIWVYNHKRENFLYLLLFTFFALLIYFGGKKGLDSILALLFTTVVFVFILLPLIFNGFDIIITSTLCAILSLVVSFLLVGGFEKKTVIAILGTFCGITVAGLVSYIFGALTNISGVNLDKGTQLVYVALDYDIKIKGIMYASILIASLGAVMDVAMSISSSMKEIYTLNPKIDFNSLFKAGMNIGKDIMGTMANTLILAFMGGSLSLMLLLYGYNMTYTQLINIPFISVEIVQGIAGSIGIVLTVPFTAFVASWLYVRK